MFPADIDKWRAWLSHQSQANDLPQQQFQLFRPGESRFDLGQRLLSQKARLSMPQENLFLETWRDE
jgi:hypothetical protein